MHNCYSFIHPGITNYHYLCYLMMLTKNPLCLYAQQQGQVFIYLLKILQACSVAGRGNVLVAEICVHEELYLKPRKILCLSLLH